MRTPADRAGVRRSPWRSAWLHGLLVGLCALAAAGVAEGLAADEASVLAEPDQSQFSNETTGPSTDGQAPEASQPEASQLEGGSPDGVASLSVAPCTNIVVARNVGGKGSVQHASAKQAVRISQNGSETQVECH
jgi:hypothetical protein